MKIYYANAFISANMSGNPAGVWLLDEPLPDQRLQSIAKDTGMPATAFLWQSDHIFFLRTFTPEYELDLCGHATHAAAAVVFSEIEKDATQLEFHTPKAVIQVYKDNGLIFLDFPLREIKPCDPSELLIDGLGGKPQSTYHYNQERCLAVFEKEEDVRSLKPNIDLLKQLRYRGIDVTAPGKLSDLVCRTFYPKKTLNTEDPVCGSAHCVLAPYWAKRLNKTRLVSHQLSERGGALVCEVKADRVLIGGEAEIRLSSPLPSNKMMSESIL